MIVKLNTTSILNVPLNTYDDFTFIVNGKCFKTTRIIAELLSPKISQLYLTDPTTNKFVITTTERGNFANIFSLLNFNQAVIPDDEIPFFTEIFNILNNNSIEITQQDNAPISLDNVFDLIKKHQQYETFYSKQLQKEIDFVSFNFFELDENQTDLIKKFSKNIIEQIITNPKLRVHSEDQILTFINQLYLKDQSYSYLYDYVLFSNATSNKIKEFLDIFDINNITQEMWRSLSYRIEQDVTKTDTSNYNKKRYYKKFSCFYSDQKIFNGIINFLRTRSKSLSFNDIKISSSSIWNEDEKANLMHVLNYNDYTTEFCSNDNKDPWICFDFKKSRVIPFNYTIRSHDGSENDHYPKSWVIEGSNDNIEWKVIDVQNNCSFLKGSNLVHTFEIQNPDSLEFRYLRMKITGPDWCDCVHLNINCIEFYGELITYDYI